MSVQKANFMSGKLSRIIAAIMLIVFAIIWTYSASSMGAPIFFPLFGLAFIAIAVYLLIKALFSR